MPPGSRPRPRRPCSLVPPCAMPSGNVRPGPGPRRRKPGKRWAGLILLESMHRSTCRYGEADNGMSSHLTHICELKQGSCWNTEGVSCMKVNVLTCNRDDNGTAEQDKEFFMVEPMSLALCMWLDLQTPGTEFACTTARCC